MHFFCGFMSYMDTKLLQHNTWIVELICAESVIHISIKSRQVKNPVSCCTLTAKKTLKKMQLDVDVSPSANILSICLTLTKVTFDLDPSDLWPWPKWPLTLTHVTLTFISLPVKLQWDLKSLFLTWWPWPSRSTFGSSLAMPWPNFMALGAILFAIWIIVQSQTDGQTDAKASDAYEPTVH